MVSARPCPWRRSRRPSRSWPAARGWPRPGRAPGARAQGEGRAGLWRAHSQSLARPALSRQDQLHTRTSPGGEHLAGDCWEFCWQNHAAIVRPASKHGLPECIACASPGADEGFRLISHGRRTCCLFSCSFSHVMQKEAHSTLPQCQRVHGASYAGRLCFPSLQISRWASVVSPCPAESGGTASGVR